MGKSNSMPNITLTQIMYKANGQLPKDSPYDITEIRRIICDIGSDVRENYVTKKRYDALSRRNIKLQDELAEVKQERKKYKECLRLLTKEI